MADKAGRGRRDDGARPAWAGHGRRATGRGRRATGRGRRATGHGLRATGRDRRGRLEEGAATAGLEEGALYFSFTICFTVFVRPR